MPRRKVAALAALLLALAASGVLLGQHSPTPPVVLSPTVNGTPYPYPPLDIVRRHLDRGPAK